MYKAVKEIANKTVITEIGGMDQNTEYGSNINKNIKIPRTEREREA